MLQIQKISQENEIWKVIPNTNNRYYVSSHGRVYSTCGKGKILTPTPHARGGYLKVSIKIDGKFKTYRVHRLVAELFINRINPHRNTVNHKDGNKYNNTIYNLEWVTRQENIEHAFREGLHSKPRRAVLCVELNKVYNTVKEASIALNINQGNISHACMGNYKQAGGYTFRYLGEDISCYK